MADLRGVAVPYAAKNNEKSILGNINWVLPHRLGKCNVVCESFGALHWRVEACVEERKNDANSFSMCCQKNKVSLPGFDKSAPPYPDTLKELLVGGSEKAFNFQGLIRMYNNSISFTSLGAKIDLSVAGQKGVNVFRINGGLTHLISSIEPVSKDQVGYSQIFVVGDGGTKEAKLQILKAQGKGGEKGKGKKKILWTLMVEMGRHNPYAKFYRTAKQILEEKRGHSFKLQGVPNNSGDPKRYNQPRVEEVAIVIEGPGDIVQERQIVLKRKDDKLILISDNHLGYFPLRYPLLFSYGEQQRDNLYRASTSRVYERKIGSLEWFAYLLFERRGRFSPILHAKALFQEFLYNRLVQSLENKNVPDGRQVIVPSSFIGSPCAMGELYHDAMAICRRYGPPSLFITMTANPEWFEITDLLKEGEKAFDNPTIVARVFYLKLQELLRLLNKMDRLGTIVAFISTIEFQKRGLPHLHFMVTLDENQKPTTPEKIDLFVLAEIPDPKEEPDLHKLVTKFMLHGPCQGRACWDGKGCKYGFPKPFTERAVIIDGAYPAYLRRDDGRTVKKHATQFDNQNVVAYNRYLTLAFECHINVEIPVNTTAIKYLYKYITKGHDRSYLEVEGYDGTKAFIDARYMSPLEAAWRLLKFPMSNRYPAVTRLNIHQEDEQLVYFPGEESAVGQLESGKAGRTTLTEYFMLNQEDARGAKGKQARSLTYTEIVSYFSWNKADKIWKPRKAISETLGRLFSVHYLAGEKFYLCVLLLHRRGATSFGSLRTVDNVRYETYHEACNALGLLIDGVLYDNTLSKASLFHSGFQLTEMFAMMCVHTPPSDPLALFENHYEPFTNDLTRVNMSRRDSSPLNLVERRFLGLFRLEEIIKNLGSSLENCGIKLTNEERSIINELNGECEIEEEMSDVKQRLNKNCLNFNREQEDFFWAVKTSLKKGPPRLFYLDGPGGTGKTLLLNTLIDYATFSGIKTQVVAASGVAALLLLLKGGQTAHSAFKIPIDAEENAECFIEPDTNLGAKLKEVKLIIWDEVVTMHRYSIEAIDKTLQRICSSTLPFGGKHVIFSGDFRQILPVVKYNQYPNNNPDGKNVAFAKSLLDLGKGRGQKTESKLIDPDHINIKSFESLKQSNNALIEFVYEDLEANHRRQDDCRINYLNERCILAPLNKDVNKLNAQITSRLPGESFISKSIDIPDPDGCDSLPEECLNKISLSSLPEHIIEIKIGMSVVITRNINIKKGICNGSRMIVTGVGTTYLAGKLMSGPFSGVEIMLPKIKLHNKGSPRSGLSFYRYQFPLRPAYAMSVNKSHGQTLTCVGVTLETDVFAHGQLYVALSRVSNVNNLLVVKPAARVGVMNVVHKQIFKDVKD
ncbi:hypothetical protein MJO28_017129 [Puccinia striiformis f. sp. tritici]|nr:hypothetical protein MJO28_017129 [Puccinia striiformis f. sp. tritici]